MRRSISTSYEARIITSALWGGLLLLALAAPLLSAHSHPWIAALCYLVFSPICHQDASRCFSFGALPWAVCQRCSGIYLGLFIAALLPLHMDRLPRLLRSRRNLVIACTALLMCDAVLPILGIWTNTPASRFLSGLFFGAMLSTLLVPGIAELLRGFPWPHLQSHAPDIHGGTS